MQVNPYITVNYSKGSRPDGRYVKQILLDLIERDGYLCCWCGIETSLDVPLNALDRSSVEHVIRLADGGTNDPENLRVACRKCNNERHKGDMQ